MKVGQQTEYLYIIFEYKDIMMYNETVKLIKNQKKIRNLRNPKTKLLRAD